MYKRIYSFLEKHKVLYKLQFGFRSGHSTSHALISLTELIKKSLDKGEYSCGVFIDLQKAFDTVDHEILLSKLSLIGIRGIANKWVESFLTNRKQFVHFSGISSPNNVIKCGVPQGSTLGPLLFLIYINDLHKIFENSTVHHFADDTNLLFSNKKLSTIETVINYELKLLVNWLNCNKLSLNTSKTEVILFKPLKQKEKIEISIKLKGKKLQLKKYVTYLGVIIDDCLLWEEQIESLCLKLSKCIGILSKLRHYVNLHTLVNIYYSLFYSHLIYGSLAWQYTSNHNIDKIFRLQKKCLRIITYSPYNAHSNKIFLDLKLIKIPDLFTSQVVQFLFQWFNKSLPGCLQDLFKFSNSIHHHNTRYPNKCFIPHVNTQHYGISSLYYNGPYAWNDLQNKIDFKECKSIYSMKNRLKDYYLGKYENNL